MLCVSSWKEAEKEEELSHASVLRGREITISPRGGVPAQKPVGWGSRSCVGRWDWNRAGWEGGAPGIQLIWVVPASQFPRSAQGQLPFPPPAGKQPPGPRYSKGGRVCQLPTASSSSLGRWQEVWILTPRSLTLGPFLSKSLPPWAPEGGPGARHFKDNSLEILNLAGDIQFPLRGHACSASPNMTSNI